MSGYFKSFKQYVEQMSKDNLRRLRSLKIFTVLGIDMNSVAEIVMANMESDLGRWRADFFMSKCLQTEENWYMICRNITSFDISRQV